MAIHIEPATLARLRDTLRDSGRRPSVVITGAYETLARAGMMSPEEQTMLVRIEPLAEVMFLMMAADGTVADVERDVVRGAIRGLSDGEIRSGTIKVMLEKFDADLKEAGRAARIEEIADALRDDPPSAESAFVLAAAVAYADDTITDDENALINELADRLGIPDERANELLDALDADRSALRGHRKAGRREGFSQPA